MLPQQPCTTQVSVATVYVFSPVGALGQTGHTQGLQVRGGEAWVVCLQAQCLLTSSWEGQGAHYP
jgi:hypothetical protein